MDHAGIALEEIPCVQRDRVVGRDNSVSRSGLSLQIPVQSHRRHYAKVTVTVHEYPDGRLAVFDAARCLARYAANGVLIDDPK